MAGEKLIGRLATGIGMGKKFTRLDWARAQFMEKLGIDPYPGTINVIVDDPDSMPVWMRVKRGDGIPIDNPNDGPHDCDAKAWRVSIDDRIDGAIVFPLVEDYPPAQIEIIAEIGVRGALSIEDGDTVTLTLKD
jgi:CTP-dependent riboflavin kinase